MLGAAAPPPGGPWYPEPLSFTQPSAGDDSRAPPHDRSTHLRTCEAMRARRLVCFWAQGGFLLVCEVSSRQQFLCRPKLRAPGEREQPCVVLAEFDLLSFVWSPRRRYRGAGLRQPARSNTTAPSRGASSRACRDGGGFTTRTGPSYK